MKEENKIPLDVLLQRLSIGMQWEVDDEAWDTLLFGWRKKNHYQKAHTDKVWLSLKDVDSLAEYAQYDIRTDPENVEITNS